MLSNITSSSVKSKPHDNPKVDDKVPYVPAKWNGTHVVLEPSDDTDRRLIAMGWGVL